MRLVRASAHAKDKIGFEDFDVASDEKQIVQLICFAQRHGQTVPEMTGVIAAAALGDVRGQNGSGGRGPPAFLDEP